MLQVEDLGDVPAVARDLALVKVAVAGHDRAQLLRVVDETRAHIVDTGEQTMTLEITGEPPHVDAVIARLEPLGIVEMVRTGQVAMRRGDTALSAAQYSYIGRMLISDPRLRCAATRRCESIHR